MDCSLSDYLITEIYNRSLKAIAAFFFCFPLDSFCLVWALSVGWLLIYASLITRDTHESSLTLPWTTRAISPFPIVGCNKLHFSLFPRRTAAAAQHTVYNIHRTTLAETIDPKRTCYIGPAVFA